MFERTADCTVSTARIECVSERKGGRERPGVDAAVVTDGAEQLGTYKIVRAGIRHI